MSTARAVPRTPGFLRGVAQAPAPHAPPFLVDEPEREPPAPPPPAPPPPPAVRAPEPAPAPTPVPAAPPAELLARYAASIEALRQQGERLAAQARADAIEIGFQVARRILEIELSTSAEPLFSLVRSAIRRAGEGRTLTVRLHPADLAAVEGAGGAASLGPTVAHVQLETDSTLERGDCVIDTGQAVVDGRLATRLSELQRSVERTLAEEA